MPVLTGSSSVINLFLKHDLSMIAFYLCFASGKIDTKYRETFHDSYQMMRSNLLKVLIILFYYYFFRNF